jgi:hypothetical protein
MIPELFNNAVSATPIKRREMRELTILYRSRPDYGPAWTYYTDIAPEGPRKKRTITLLLTSHPAVISLIFILIFSQQGPPLWYSGQSSWLRNGDVLHFL